MSIVDVGYQRLSSKKIIVSVSIDVTFHKTESFYTSSHSSASGEE